MKRRDFFKLSASSGLTLGASACSHVMPTAPLHALGVGSIEEYVARMDHGMDYIARKASIGDHLQGLRADIPRPTAARPAYLDRSEELFRKTMRTTVLTGMFSDLPPELQKHPAVQERMWRHMPEMDETVTEMTYILEQLDATQREDIRRVLQQTPELGATLAAEIDVHARNIDVSTMRRAQFNDHLQKSAWQMGAQSPSLLIDGYTTKVRKAQARHGMSAELERAIAAQMGEEAFWAHQRSMAALSDKYMAQGWATSDGTMTPQEQRDYLETYRKKQAKSVLTAGGWILGVSAFITLIGVVFLSLDVIGPGLVLGVTIGPIGLAVGLITLIVGGIMYAVA